MTARRVALASAVPETDGDRLLIAALAREGALARHVIWSDFAVHWSAFDTVLLRACWDYHRRLPEFLAWIAAIEATGARVLNPPGLIRWNSSKRYLLELAGMGVLIPSTILIDPRATDEEIGRALAVLPGLMSS